MASFWRRKDKQKGGLSPPAADLGIFIQEKGPKLWVEDAVRGQPVMGDPEEDFVTFCSFRRPGKGWQLGRALQLLWHSARVKNGNKQHRDPQGAQESWTSAGMQAQAAQGCAGLGGKAAGLPEEPRTCRKATRGGEDCWDDPIVGCEARDGDVPRGRGGCGDGMGQTQPLVQEGAGGDGKGRTTRVSQSVGTWEEDKGAATVPARDRDRQDVKRPSAWGRCGEERRRRVWEMLRRLGEDVARWEGRSTRDLAARLVEVILQTDTATYPMGTGMESDRQEQGLGGTPAGVGGSEEARALVGTRADVTTVQQCLRLPYLAVCRDVPVSIDGTVDGDEQHLPTAPEPPGQEQMWEDPEDELLEQGGSPAPAKFMVLACRLGVEEVRNEERWREEFPAVWARYEMDCGLVSEEEKVRGAPVPFQWQPPLPADVEEAVASILQDLLADGVVVEGFSSSNSPLRPTTKRDGRTMRLALNCEAINRVTPKVVPPVSLDRTKLVATLSPQSRYFSTVDLSNASFAVPLAPGSRARFAFTFRGQQYLFTRLPQGFHSTNAILHRRVARMLAQLPHHHQPWVVSYIDDILIAGRSREETEARTREVLMLIQKTGFKAKFEKAQLVRPKVDYLGMSIGAEGREIQASKREAIARAPSPWDVDSLRSLLGQFGNLQVHIPGYWELARPLHRLTAAQAEWEWGPEQEEALSRLKRTVLEAPPLRFPDTSQPFVITITSGEEAMAATLLQEDEGGRLVPVGHNSCILKDHEVSYPPQEKGCLAALWAVRVFETLTGPAPLLIPMPHSPRKYLLRGKGLGSHGVNPHPARWTLLVVNGGATATGPPPEWGHPPSTLVPTAPPLRLVLSHVPKANIWFVASAQVGSVGFAAASMEERWLLGVAEGDSVLGAGLVALEQLLQRHRGSSPLYLYTGCCSLVQRLQTQMGEREPGACGSSGQDPWLSIVRWVHANPGMLRVGYVGWDGDEEEEEWRQKVGRRARGVSGRAVGWQTWEPSKHEKQEIIARCHSWAHEGVEGTLARVRQVAAWEGDSVQVTHWVRNCLVCPSGRDGAGRVLPQRTEGPWAQLQLGFIKGLPESEEGLRSLLLLGDEFSGWVDAVPMQAGTVEDAIEVLLRKVFGRYGTPRAIRLPNAPRFLRDAVQAVMLFFDVELPGDIAEPGLAGPATAALRRLVRSAGKSWARMLPLILAGIRSVGAREAALGPFQLAFGFPLEMRWECEAGGCPAGNPLPWLGQLRGDGAGYKQRMEAALQGGCPEGDAP